MGDAIWETDDRWPNRPVRRPAIVILMLLALAGPAFAQIDTEAMKDRETTCFGKKATIVVRGPAAVFGTESDDVIVGDGGSNTIQNTIGGVDRVCAGGGDDFIFGGPDARLLADGGGGDDFLEGTDFGDDVLLGGGGGDNLSGGGGGDRLAGGEGDDALFGEAGNDALAGGAGDDRLFGDADVPGLGGEDDLIGGAGNDRLVGGGDNDILAGGKGDDSCDQDFEGSGEASFLC